MPSAPARAAALCEDGCFTIGGLNGDDHRKLPTARQWLLVRIGAALLGVVLVAADLVWKLAAGWFAADQGHPPTWLYLPPRAAAVVVLVWFAWRTWLVARSSGRRALTTLRGELHAEEATLYRKARAERRAGLAGVARERVGVGGRRDSDGGRWGGVVAGNAEPSLWVSTRRSRAHARRLHWQTGGQFTSCQGA